MTSGIFNNLRGLVLTGGKSSRMGFPKAEINYNGQPEYIRCCKLLSTVCDEVFLSTSKFWSPSVPLDGVTLIPDDENASGGPLCGIASALERYPNTAWIVLACDLPFFDSDALAELCVQRDKTLNATCFTGYQGRPEPLCAIYETSSAKLIFDAVKEDRRCARKLIESMQIKRILPSNSAWVRNVNDKYDYESIVAAHGQNAIEVEIQYVAQLREEAGKSVERIATQQTTLQGIYEELRTKYGFALKPQHMRVVVNDEIVDWQVCAQENDEIMFLPPVAGG